MSEFDFSGMTDDGLAEAEDRLGGFSAIGTDAYKAKIKVIYAGKAESGAKNMTVIADINGTEFRETIYITNKAGENFFYPKTDGKPDLTKQKQPLPGYTTINDILLFATKKPLAQNKFEERVLKVWDSKEGKEVNKAVQVAVEAIGQEVGLCILKSLEDKTKKEGNEYVPTGETRDANSIDKVFSVTTEKTASETRKELAPEFVAAWVEKNRGQVKDNSSKNAKGVKSGRPGETPTAGNTPRKSLFD